MPVADSRPPIALDTSAAIPYLVQSHTHHQLVSDHLSDYAPALTAHSLAETYSVLTRLTGDARHTPADAASLIEANFTSIVSLPAATARSIHTMLASRRIAGGAVYDGMVALAAQRAGLPLATRDARATATYLALAVEVQFIGG